MNGLIPEFVKPVWMAAPVNLTGVGMAGDWVNMGKARQGALLLIGGAWASATPAFALLQATSAAGAGSKAFNFDRYFHATGLTADTFVEVSGVAANTFNLANVANKLYVIPFLADQMDNNNSFRFVSFTVADPSANDFLAAVLLLGDLNFPSYPPNQETVIV